MEDCLKCQKEHTFRLETLEEEMKEGKKALVDHKVKIEKIDESVKSAHSRLNEIGEQTKAIYKLSVAVENMAEQFKDFTSNFKDHEDRLDTLERSPGQEAYDREKQVKNYILIAIVAAVFGAVMMKLGVKI